MTKGAQLRNECTSCAISYERADKNESGSLAFEEFLSLFPPSMRERRSDEELRVVFDSCDLNHDGDVVAAEFFVFALRFAQKMLAVRLEEAFAKFDRTSSGTLDKIEWRDAMKSFGFEHAADEIFELLDFDDSGEISYHELEATAPSYDETPLLKEIMREFTWDMHFARKSGVGSGLPLLGSSLKRDDHASEALNELKDVSDERRRSVAARRSAAAGGNSGDRRTSSCGYRRKSGVDPATEARRRSSLGLCAEGGAAEVAAEGGMVDGLTLEDLRRWLRQLLQRSAQLFVDLFAGCTGDDFRLSATEFSGLVHALDDSIPVVERKTLAEALLREFGAPPGGSIPFLSFKAWVQGADSERVRKEKAIMGWQLRANSAEGLRCELQELMARDRIQVADLFDRFDKDGDHMIRKRELLVAMKLFVNDEARWEESVRDAIDEIWSAMAANVGVKKRAAYESRRQRGGKKNGEGRVLLGPREFDNWLSEGTAADVEADHCAAEARARGSHRLCGLKESRFKAPTGSVSAPELGDGTSQTCHFRSVRPALYRRTADTVKRLQAVEMAAWGADDWLVNAMPRSEVLEARMAGQLV